MRMSDEIHQTQATIFEQQEDSVRAFLHRLHYSNTQIRTYQTTGLWPRLITDCFTNYIHLIQMLLHWSALHGYANGLAERMLTHHANQLHQIRTYAPSYTRFQARVYIYLREVKASQFDHISVYRPLLQDIIDKSMGDGGQAGGGGGSGGTQNSGSQACLWCKSKAAHDKMGVAKGYSSCPFKSGCNRTQAKAAAKHLLAAFDANPSLDKAEAVRAAIAVATDNP
jgi:hypothetical protein